MSDMTQENATAFADAHAKLLGDLKGLGLEKEAEVFVSKGWVLAKPVVMAAGAAGLQLGKDFLLGLVSAQIDKLAGGAR